MKLSMIVAMNEQRVIGVENRLPWHLPEDLRRFKQLTMGHPIIMGRKTFESIGRALPGRPNLVLSRQTGKECAGAACFPDLSSAVQYCHNALAANEVFIIGGATIYEQALPDVDTVYVTEVDKDVVGDAFFPRLTAEDFRCEDEPWQVSQGAEHLRYRYLTFRRV